MFQTLASYFLGSSAATNDDGLTNSTTATTTGVENASLRLTATEAEDEWVIVDRRQRDDDRNSDGASECHSDVDDILVVEDGCGDLAEDDVDCLGLPNDLTTSDASCGPLMSSTRSLSSLPCTTHVEDSWFLTPPPCFVSTGPVTMPVTSPLENLLIEHPSMSVYSDHFRSTTNSSSSNTVVTSLSLPAVGMFDSYVKSTWPHNRCQSGPLGFRKTESEVDEDEENLEYGEVLDEEEEDEAEEEEEKEELTAEPLLHFVDFYEDYYTRSLPKKHSTSSYSKKIYLEHVCKAVELTLRELDAIRYCWRRQQTAMGRAAQATLLGGLGLKKLKKSKMAAAAQKKAVQEEQIDWTEMARRREEQKALIKQQAKEALPVKRAQKAQAKRSRKAQSRGHMDRQNKAREVNCRNHRQRRGERSQGLRRSHANNNRKC